MKHSSYPSYRDSGVEWLGEVPEHWETIRLKFLCNITTGGKDTENKIDDGEYPFYVRSQTIERINSYSFNGEAILTAGDGVGVGKVFHYVNGKFDFHQRVYMFYAFKKVAGRFLFEYIKNNFYKVALAGVAKSTVDSLRLPLIQNFMITVPPFQEQQTIANYLDKATAKIDTLIEKQTKLIELLKEKRQAVISTAVTRGLDNTVAMKDSGVEWLGEIPEHWIKTSFKRIGFIRYGIGEPPKYKTSGVALIRATNVKSGFIVRKGIVFVDPKDIPSQRIIWLKIDDIIVVRSGALTGDSAIITSEYNNTIAGFDMVFRINKAVPMFIQYTLLSHYIKNNQIDQEKMRAAQPHLNAEELGSCIFVMPPTEEQESIVIYLNQKTSKTDNLITKSTKAIDLLKEKRTALISSVVTGKIDVRKET